MNGVKIFRKLVCAMVIALLFPRSRVPEEQRLKIWALHGKTVVV